MEQCGASTESTAISCHHIMPYIIYIHHGDPWCARLFLSVSIRLEMRTLAWQILGQNFRIDTAALLNGIASKRAKACSHCAAL